MAYVTLTANASRLIFKARRSAGLSARRLASKAGVSEKTLASVEKPSSRRRRLERTIWGIAEALDLDFFSLVVADEEPSTATESAEDPLPGASGAPYRVAAAERADLEWIAESNRVVYEGIDQISLEKMQDWYDQNPGGFFVTRDRFGRISGNIDILPVRPDPFRRFLEGKCIEADWTGEDILPPGEVSTAKSLYVESFVSVTDDRRGNPVCTLSQLAAVPAMLERVLGENRSVDVFAIGGSEGGIALMKHLGFRAIADPGSRVDEHHLFHVRLSDLCRAVVRLVASDRQSRLLALLDQIDDTASL